MKKIILILILISLVLISILIIKPRTTSPPPTATATTESVGKDYLIADKNLIYKSEKHKIETISREAHVNYFKDCFKHPGMGSPDKQTSISFESYDPVSYTLTVNKNDGSKEAVGEFYQTVEEAYWSPDSKKVAFVDEDYYAGSGQDSLTIINVETLTEIKIPLKDLVHGQDIGEREMFYASTPCWIANDKLVFAVKVNYLGDSGHPGINSNREARLGEKFGLDDPIDLGSFIIQL